MSILILFSPNFQEVILVKNAIIYSVDCQRRHSRSTLYVLGGHWAALRLFFTACSKLVIMAIYLVKQACCNDIMPSVYLVILKNVPNLYMRKIKRAIQKFKEWNWKQTFLFQVWARIRITIFKASRYWDTTEWNNFWRSILFIFMFLMYSSVPNRRIGPNKRAGGKILKKH